MTVSIPEIPGVKTDRLSMRLVTWDEYREFVSMHKHVNIENVRIPIGQPYKVSSYSPPGNYKPETTTVWSFPDRGDWATHVGNYRGNWSPYVPRNLILKYTKPGELVLDQMVGSGTTIIEAKLLGRDAIGIDINYEAVILTLDRLNFQYKPLDEPDRNVTIKVYHGDATNLDKISDNEIDLVATHPPYWGIISYGKGPLAKPAGNLSAMKRLEDYIDAMRKAATESFRVLRPGRYCATLVGDTRRHKHYVPISHRVMQVFLEAGFVLAEDIIKMQHKMKTTREKWRGERFELYGFHKIAHEHLFVFRKPSNEKEKRKLKLSARWS